MLALVLCFGVNSAKAQAPKFSLALQAGVSYSGWNLGLVGQYQLDDFQFYAGPTISLNRGLPGRGPVGINAGSSYFLHSQHDWLGSLVSLDYQFNLFPNGSAPANRLHEMHLAYGVVFMINEKMYVAQQIGGGFYLESAYVSSLDQRRRFDGFSGLVKLRAGYAF